MSNLNPLLNPHIARVRGAVGPLLVLAGVALTPNVSQAQKTGVPFQAGSRSNVEVRHTPGAQVWPSTVGRTTNAIGGGRIPPTIEKTANGVKATFNPSWLVKSRRQISTSGKVSIICDDEMGVHVGHSHSKNEAPKKRPPAPKKMAHSTNQAR